MKKLCLLCAAIFMFIIPCSAAADIPKVTSKFFVNDYANVIDDSTEQQIYNIGANLEQKTKAQAVVVVINSLNGESIDNYANKLGSTWGVGQKGENNGLVLLVAVNDHKVKFEIGDGLGQYLNAAKAGRILDQYVVPQFKNNNYSKGILDGYTAAVNEIYKGMNIAHPEGQTTAKAVQSTQKNSINLKSALIIIGLIFLFNLIAMRGHRGGKDGRGGGFFFGGFGPFGGFGGGGGNSGDGGGFGGGGDFGGFSGGGGDFGGGGASRGW